MTLERQALGYAILAVGLAVAGGLVGSGFSNARMSDRFVTVKGVSERDARADLALWPIQLVIAEDDLRAAYTRLNAEVGQVRRFLASNGIDTTRLEVHGFSVSDAQANQYRNSSMRGSRYVIRQTLMVRSNDAGKVLAASQRVGDLVAAGVVLSTGEEYRSGGPTFVFTGLNALKPTMIAEATARAREAATQFANDSHSHLAGIRQASQGVFEILPRDQAQGIDESSEIAKRVRVVTTVEYFLRD